jgi:hypothetical protein
VIIGFTMGQGRVKCVVEIDLGRPKSASEFATVCKVV